MMSQKSCFLHSPPLIQSIPQTSMWIFYVVLFLTMPKGLRLTSAQSSSCHETGAMCIPLSGPGTAPPTCFGAPLRFSHTSLLWTNNSGSLTGVTSRLKLWEGMSSVPECWAVLQPLLCSVYLPKCDLNLQRVDYPSLELCEKTREPCRVVEEFAKVWPQELRCTQPYFKLKCGTGAYDQLPYNTTGTCQEPLVRTQRVNSWWRGLEGCGIRCQDPLYSESQHHLVHLLLAVLGALCLLCTVFTILTFVIDWQNASRYPALILFFINLCFLLATVGWMAQFSGDARSDIVCRGDGTARRAEPQPGSGDSASCTVVFVLIYYFTMAALLWFVMLCYSWHLTFRALGRSSRDDLSSKTAYFHLVSWSLPLVLTIVCLALSEIDGDWLSGVCFVGHQNHAMRAGFVLVPVASVLIVGLFFLSKGLVTLIRIKKDVPEFVGEKATAKIKDTIVRLSVFSVLAVVLVATTFSIHIYIFIYNRQWTTSLEDYLHCLTHRTVVKSVGSDQHPPPCVLPSTPSLVAMVINMATFFLAGILMSSWSWTGASLSAWQRFFGRLFHKPSHKPVKLKRRHMTSPPNDRRRDINDGRMSFSFQSAHDDPLGMKVDLNSMSSNLSHLTSFAHAMPHLVHRHSGLLYPRPRMVRRHSDSDIASIMSRRLSQNSQGLPHGLHSNGQCDHVDNSSYAGSEQGGWRRNKRRRRKQKRKRNTVQPILGPVLSGQGFRSHKDTLSPMLGNRRGSESSVVSKASSAQAGLRLHAGNPAFRPGGSLTSLNERLVSVSEVIGHVADRSRRQKLPQLPPPHRKKMRSWSSSRSSLTAGGGGGGLPFGPAHLFPPLDPYSHPYGGYDYAQLYASLGYPQMAYPYWPFPYPYPNFPHQQPQQQHQQQPHQQPPQQPQQQPQQQPPPQHQQQPPQQQQQQPQQQQQQHPTTDFSIFSANTALSRVVSNSSSPEMEKRKVVTSSTSRRQEMTMETQQTETVSVHKVKVKAEPEFKKPSASLSDDSIEDLNSSELDNSVEELNSSELDESVEELNSSDLDDSAAEGMDDGEEERGMLEAESIV